MRLRVAASGSLEVVAAEEALVSPRKRVARKTGPKPALRAGPQPLFFWRNRHRSSRGPQTTTVGFGTCHRW